MCVEHIFKFVFFSNCEINNLSLLFVRCSGKKKKIFFFALTLNLNMVIE